MTVQRKIEAPALVEYFKPLKDWLEKKNKETVAHIGMGLGIRYVVSILAKILQI